MFFNFGGPGGHGHGHGGGRPSRASEEVDNSKFYELLEIEKTATQDEVKKAFRKAALKHHPDRGGDPEKFKEIQRAHEVLSDPEKRAVYDEAGEEGLSEQAQGGGGGGGMDIFDLFGGGMFGGGGRPRGKKKGDDVVFPLKVTLEDLYNGTSKKLRLTKNIICEGCKGKGGKDGKEATCTSCRGQGVKLAMRQIGPGMIQQVPMKCQACSGTGSQIAEKDKCQTCKGERTTKQQKTLEVFVTKGMKHNEKIVFKGEADEAPDQLPGDVVVVLQMAEHPTFKREGHNLTLKKTITLIEALTGFEFLVSHLDGRVLKVKSEPGMIVKPGQIKSVVGEGMPHPKNPFTRGDLLIEMDVTFPTRDQLNEQSVRALTAVLPRPAKVEPRKSQPPPSATGEAGKGEAPHDLQDFYEVDLVTVDMEAERAKQQQQERHEREESYDDEDDEGHHHGHRAQAGCQQQ